MLYNRSGAGQWPHLREEPLQLSTRETPVQASWAGVSSCSPRLVRMSTTTTLLGPAEIRELAERAGVRPTKQLGQNFVLDGGTVRKIVRQADVAAGDRVVEVGPGLGSLTLGLLEAGADVVAVEIDPTLARLLPTTVAAARARA